MSLEDFYKKRGERKKGLNAGSKNPMYGKTTSAKQKARAREVGLLRGRLPPEALTKSMAKTMKKVIDTKTKIVYESVYVASQAFGIHRATLGDYLRGDSPNKTTLQYLSKYNEN